jgi:cell division protein FtsW
MRGILNQKNYQGDRVLWMVTGLLLMASVLAVYSAVAGVAYKEAGGNTFFYLIKHLVMIGVGFVAMFTIHKVNFRYFSKLSVYLLWISVGLLVLTLLFGTNVNSASRWLKIPLIGISFQTSDFAKVAIVLYVARMLNQNRTILHNFRDGVWPVLWPVLLVCALIFPSNFSTAALVFSICFLMMFIGGVPMRHLSRIVGVFFLGLVFAFLFAKIKPDALPRLNTWIKRIENFANPESEGNYQVRFAEIAINEGGLLPKGPGTSASRYVMPNPYNDMIYAFIIEEYGSLFGGAGLLLLYLIFGFRAVRNGVRCPKPFGSLVSVGLGLLVMFQALIHMAVAVRLFPTTGQMLPLVSMGGTGTIINMMVVGILISVSRILTHPEAFSQDIQPGTEETPDEHQEFQHAPA